MNRRFDLRFAGVPAPLSAVFAALFAGSALEGYSHRDYPLAYLGASGVPGAAAFNLFAFVLPGLLAFAAAWALRESLPAGASWRARIGAQLVALAALGFAAQGALPLQPEQPDAVVNGLHASAWMLWWIAFLPGAALLALGGAGRRLALASAAAAIAVAALALAPWSGAMSAFAPRLASLVWLLWVAGAPLLPARASA